MNVSQHRFMVLDSFRGLAAVFVVLYHLNFAQGFTEASFVRGSAVLVEFFFVLSGFVLAHGYAYQDNLKFKPYIRARFFRIYPLHFVMLIVFIMFELGKWGAFEYLGITFNRLPFSEQNNVQEILPNALLLHSWLGDAATNSFNYTSWSISIELYLYVFLFLTIAVFHAGKVYAWLLLSTVALVALFFGSEALKLEVLKGVSGFFLGALAYSVFRNYSMLKLPKHFATAIEVALFVLVYFVVTTNFAYKALVSPFVFILTIYFFAYEAGVLSSMLKAAALQTLGKLSYSIYMTHAAVIFIFTSSTVVAAKLGGWQLSVTTESGFRYLDYGGYYINSLLAIGLLAATIAISTVTYRYIELPWQRYGKSK